MSDTPQGASWWQGPDSKWYPPEQAPLPPPPLPRPPSPPKKTWRNDLWDRVALISILVLAISVLAPGLIVSGNPEWLGGLGGMALCYLVGWGIVRMTQSIRRRGSSN